MKRLFACVALLLLPAPAAWAQGEEPPAPDEEFLPWSAPPGPASTSAPAPAPAVPAPGDESSPPLPAPTPLPASPARAPAPTVVRRLTPREFNHVSLYGAPTLGQWRRGFGAYLGFPLLGMKAGVGLLEHLDVGLGFDSFYGVMNEPRGFVKLQLVDHPRFALALQLEAGAAFFAQTPEEEGRGARWLTGRRNYNLEPGVILSYQGDLPQSARLFLDLRYALALDTEPYTRTPLGGVPPRVELGQNVPVRMGAEMPFSPSTSFLFIFGFDVHGRAEDARFMPVVSVGLVTGI